MLDNFINFVDFGRIFGLKNLFLIYLKSLSPKALPLSFPVFGLITYAEEALNIRDNILKGSLRNRRIEKEIRKAKNPVIIDCGINIGITARWWFYLNPAATVYGIDMMREANEFTLKALPECFRNRFVSVTAAMSSESNRIFNISYTDPLFGGNSLLAAKDEGPYVRKVRSLALDDLLDRYHIETADLLKVDVEAAAEFLFYGAQKSLPKIKNILLEIHCEKERKNSVSLLLANGFSIIKDHKRQIWFSREMKAAS